MKRFALKPIRERNPIAVAIAGLAVLAVLALAAYNSSALPFIGGGTGYTAYVSETAGLQPGNEVRIAGVKVGQVTGVSLDGNKVAVAFTVKNAWVGNQTTAAIKIKTLLGEKYLAIDPLGSAAQNPSQPIPLSRTSSPFDVTQAFGAVGQQITQINTTQLARGLQALSSAFSGTPPYVRNAMRGLASLSSTVASRDAAVTKLLAGTRQITGTLAGQDAKFASLLGDGNLLLSELRQRQAAIHSLLLGTQALAIQLSGLVHDDQAKLGPTLTALNQVAGILQRNQANLAKALALAGPYYRLLGNAVGNGRWFDTYLCGLVPKSYVPGNIPPQGCKPPKP
ncbi:MAG TPA: MCE family protein [Streptosporangiaceae bacterium]|nr:MCE family protein [Streptosporangiaceae bacterium]